MITMFLLTVAAHAADPACGPVNSALDKLYTLPFHTYNSETAQFMKGKTRDSETISLDKKLYVQVNGQWRATTMDTSFREKREAAEKSNASCRVMGEESVNGETTVRYSIHQQNEAAKIDTQMWISKARGLPVKQEIDMDVGGAYGKSHTATRYEFTNVKAPSVH